METDDKPDDVTSDAVPATPYYLAWQATQPVSTADLCAAADLAQQILVDAGNPAYMEIHWVEGELGGHVELRSADTFAWFGYPPRSFLDSLNARERIAVLEQGASRDGWLSAKGTGQGVMVTGKETVDFPVRLFLSILAGKSQSRLMVTDSDELDLTGRVSLPLDVEQFAWFPLWETRLKQAVETHWVVEGQAARVTSTDTHYAW